MLGQIAAHHLNIGTVFIASTGFLVASSNSNNSNTIIRSNHAQLSSNLAISGSFSIVFAHHISAIPIYVYLGSDYPTVLCLFYHHVWLGGFLIIGACSHSSIYMIRDYQVNQVNQVNQVLNHRYIIIGHLIYLSITLGLHSFGLYIHNDTIQSFFRREDMFTDQSIQLKPLLAIWVQS